ncbi:MAG: leucine-rich repeat domain-containing protein [Verrucomicrobiia bacterium]
MLNQKGSLADLSPLKGMQLTWLWCHNNPISDLTPLKNMPLTVLSFGGTQVSDLSPLTGMKLQVLSFNDTVVSDIAPLEGSPLTVLWCNNTKVTDLTPLKTMPLQELKCDQPVAAQNAAGLRSIRSLAKINDLPTATFWARVGPVAVAAVSDRRMDGTAGAQRAPLQKTTPLQLTMPTSAPSGLSAKKQIEQFVVKMKELNPDFDGQVTHEADGRKVTELVFVTTGITDISPVQNFKYLRKLVCGRWRTTSSLADISPLKGLPLNFLDIQCCSLVRDLTPLSGMKLQTLVLNNCKGVSDLSPLKGMPMTHLDCGGTSVSDLGPLKGMPLDKLFVHKSMVADLSPLQGMRLTKFECCLTKISDLSPIKNMPLAELSCDFVPERDRSILRSITTLKTINGVPTKEFWKHVAAGDVPQAK